MNAIVILLIVLCATVLSLTGVRKLRPGVLLARGHGIPRKGLLTNVNTRTLRTELNSSMRVGRTPANRLYPAELSDGINVLQPQQTENQLAQSLNKVHRIKAVHRKRKWRWRHRHKLTAIGISALLVVSTCVVRSTVTYSKVSPRGATSYGCTNETQYESRTVQSMQCRPRVENSVCWFDCCYLTDAPSCSVKLLPADKWQADGTWPQAPWDIASSISNDMLPKGVPQTFSSTGTKDPNKAGAPTMPMQKPGEPHKGTKALQQPHCPEQSAPHIQLPSGKHPLYAHLMSIINVHTFLTSTYTAEALMINGAQCIAHLLCTLVCNMMPLIAASIWLSLTGIGVVVAMHTKLSMAKSMHAGFHVHSPPLLAGYTIFLSLFGMAMRLALHAVTDLHCALTMVIAYTFIRNTHWISACLLTLYAPACFEQILQGFEAALKHTILALIRKPKRYVFAHPKTRYGSYWKRIRNRTRRMRRQMLYKYLKTICKLLTFVQRLKLHKCCTFTHGEETQNSYGEETQRTTYACTRANHGNKGCGTRCDCRHNSYTQKQHICKALNNGNACHGTGTMGCEHAPVRLNQSHALDKGKHDTGIRQNKQQKTECADMQPALSNATLISGQSETRRLQDKATKGARMHWGGGQKSEKQTQNEADNDTYLPFSTTREWLSNNHIMHCTLYLLHVQYPNAHDRCNPFSSAT